MGESKDIPRLIECRSRSHCSPSSRRGGDGARLTCGANQPEHCRCHWSRSRGESLPGRKSCVHHAGYAARFLYCLETQKAVIL